MTAAEVISRDLTEWDEFTGRLEAVNTVAVRPRVSGYVAAVRFEEGAIVSRGDLLFVIDARPFQAEVDRLRAELLRARATIQRATSELQRAERLSTENAISHEELDRRAAFAQESAAQASAIEATLRAAELNLEFTRVTAPISGRVGRAIVTEGNLVSTGPGEATLLTTVVSLDPIYASFDADEQTFLRYGDLARAGKRASARQSGLPIQMALAGDDAFPREGKMDFLDNQMDPTTGTIGARADFPECRPEPDAGPVHPRAPAGHRALSRPPDPGPRRRHRSRQAVRVRGHARPARSSTASSRSGRSSTACASCGVVSQPRRRGRRERPAARPPGRESGRHGRAHGSGRPTCKVGPQS